MRHNLAPFALAFVAACGGGTLDVTSTSHSQANVAVPPSQCVADETDLIAGQHIDAGTVTITNDSEHLFIEITTDGGWFITEAHIFAGTGEAPKNRRGTVVPGHFPYKTSYTTPVTSHAIAIPLASLNVGCGNSLNTVVHAVVKRIVNGRVVEEQTAFGNGERIDSTRWSFQNTYQTCCETPDEECRLPADDFAGVPPSVNFEACFSDARGAVLLSTLFASNTGSVLDELVDEFVGVKLNTCVGFDCIIGPAVVAAHGLINDCVIDDAELAEALRLTGVLASFNNGEHETPDVCLNNVID